ncbi:hypothetical protein QBC37DRAFT_486181 [Rhypophila decipiens]|uniref:Uncharacterized protein n=1 Tax=Rhypophila decipiens TaxID=261697 RepID=A0AAN7B3A6_9PEZI|nr:hypothetical protein QBC37DRAFT_486181 [Rhypophila decipiens]
MKFLPLFILSAAAGTAFATKGDGDNATDDENDMGWGKHYNNNSSSTSPKSMSQCRQLAHLTQLTSLASDPTKLSDLPPDKAATLKAEASQAAAQLTALQSNATLMASCSSYLAEQEMRRQCRTMAKLEKLTALVNNSTALSAKTDGDAQKMETMQAMVEDSAQELASLQGNDTLTAYCSVLERESMCKMLKKLEKMMDKAGGNGTSTAGGGGGRGRYYHGGKNETTEGGGGDENDDEKGKWQDKKAWLEELKSNATLVEMCAAMDSSDNKGTSSNGQGGDSAPDPGVITAGAERALGLQPLGNMVVSLAAVLLFSLLVL